MTNSIQIPDWLKKILDDSGLEQGRYLFSREELKLDNLPLEFVGIAESDDGGLVISKTGDGVIYRLEDGEVEVYAIDEKEFRLAMRRDEAWEELSENMPATETFGLGIILKTVDKEARELTLGLKGSSRDSAMVIQGEMGSGEMLSDALNRELSEALEIRNYEVMDVVNEGGELDQGQNVQPLFTVVVRVEGFDPEIIGDGRIGWVEMGKERLLN